MPVWVEDHSAPGTGLPIEGVDAIGSVDRRNDDTGPAVIRLLELVSERDELVRFPRRVLKPEAAWKL
ncbi:MAG: hypothetical protein M3417_02215 [Actinomycetota bacterium]|nr:hypothetical protein [Actinomycetota bacterium]